MRWCVVLWLVVGVSGDEDAEYRRSRRRVQEQHRGLIQGVLDPFRANNTWTIDERFRQGVGREWAKRRAMLSETRYEEAFVSALSRALAAGEWFANAVGCAFPRGGLGAFKALPKAQVRAFLAEALLGTSDNAPRLESAHVILKYDLDALWEREDDSSASSEKTFGSPADISEEAADLAQSLVRDGYAPVASWGLSNDFLERLSKEVDQSMRRLHKAHVEANKTTAVLSTSRGIETLESDPEGRRFMREGVLPEVAAAYLGESVKLSGYTALRLRDGLSAENYASSLWHHDRCGRRLKAFLFLHDVTNQHPTEVAISSQRTLFYSYHSVNESRYNDSWVRDNYQVAAMTGPKGGGFIFDTNTLHRGGDWATNGDRTLVIFDINHVDKSADFHHLKRKLDLHGDWKSSSVWNRQPCHGCCLNLKLDRDPSTGRLIFEKRPNN